MTLPAGIGGLGVGQFGDCASLASITIPANVRSIGEWAFNGCGKLTGLYFLGDAPASDPNAFDATRATMYYLPGARGWGATLSGRPTALWDPRILAGAGLGAGAGGFGFDIAATSNLVVVVESCGDLARQAWVPLQTNALSGGTLRFREPQWTNYPSRFYRLRWP